MAPYRALDDVSIEVAPGEALGIIGPNGAGKSTLLRIVAGVVAADSGTVEVHGTVGSMIELGLGFHPDLTARENIRIASVMQGSGTASSDFELGVAQFADLTDVLDVPIKRYSLGMRARLAFAVATHRHVDVLIVDEILAVGDREFTIKCLARIDEMRRSGTALIFVSHEMILVTMVCDRVVHLNEGAVVDRGDPMDVVGRYLSRAPSHFRRMAQPSITIDAWRMNDDITPWEHLWVEADVTVVKPGRPSVGVDLMLPSIAPDLVVSAAMANVDELRDPGRYRLRGVSGPLAVDNALLRMTFSVVDGLEVADYRQKDFRCSRGQIGGSPAVAVEPEWKVIKASTVPDLCINSVGRRSTAREFNGLRILSLHNVTKRFSTGPRGAIRAALPGRVGTATGLVGLDNVTFGVDVGEAIGVIGPNGSGKSTLLRAIAGVAPATSGSVRVHGRVVPLLGVAPGLNPELTGLENLSVIAVMMGMTEREIDDCFDIIVEFCGLGSAIDEPVKHLSSGMLARLILALGLHAPGGLLLVDEMLATGDEEFQRRTIAKVAERIDSGDSILFVSHQLSLVEQLCSRVIRLDNGRLVDDGPAAEVIDRYGSTGWAAGVEDVSGDIRIPRMEIEQRHIPVGGTFKMTGAIIVDIEQPHARVEVSYRNIPLDRNAPMSREERERISSYMATLEGCGGALSRVGTHVYELVIRDNKFLGRFDMVLSAVDERTGSVIAETWQEVMVGRERAEGFLGPNIDLEWYVERLDRTSN